MMFAIGGNLQSGFTRADLNRLLRVPTRVERWFLQLSTQLFSAYKPVFDLAHSSLDFVKYMNWA
jgi:hypothetical protein